MSCDTHVHFTTIWWEEGLLAFQAGKGFLDNPYLNEQSDKTRHWVDGYIDALIAERCGMNERQYDPMFAQGDRTHTVLDVSRDHHARQANCYCLICWMAKMVIKQREAESEDTRPG